MNSNYRIYPEKIQKQRIWSLKRNETKTDAVENKSRQSEKRRLTKI